jgi:hypothetical protein
MEDSKVYPLCYKIRETGCPPCDKSRSRSRKSRTEKSRDRFETGECLKLLSDIKQMSVHGDKSKLENRLSTCLTSYGDIYEKLGIHIYANSRGKIFFPDDARIRANFNVHVSNGFLNKDNLSMEEMVNLYNVLRVEDLRTRYNEYYKSIGFAEKSGGKKKKNTKKRKAKRKGVILL